MSSSTLTADTLRVLDDPLELQRYTRFDAGDGGIAESSLQLAGMHCAACAGTIERALTQLDGVVEAQVNAAAQRARVRWHPEQVRASDLVAAVQSAGYDAAPDTTAAARALRLAESRRLLWRLFVAGFCAMQVMMLATPAYVAGQGELAPDLRQLLNWSSWLLTLPVMWFSALPFFSGAWRSLRSARIGMDVPVALGIAVCFVASSGAAFHPEGPFGAEPYFDSLTMFVSFLLLGRYLEMKARHRAADSLEQALVALPQTAQRLDSQGVAHTVSVQRLQPGDVVRVAVGDAFPADGTLLDGPTKADEALLSGESHPVSKSKGEEVVAGSVNLGAPATVRLLRVGADTRYEAIVALMREAMSQRPSVTRVADRWAGPFLWCVLMLATLAAIAWHFIDPSRAIWVAVSVLIVTCPCALSLAAPSALLGAAGALARRGVLLRRIDALETLAHVDRVFLDKTGTLTDARPVMTGMFGCGIDHGEQKAHLLQQAASLACWSRHPLSQAIVELAPEAKALASRWKAVREEPGRGLEALDDQSRVWRLGSAEWLGISANANQPDGTPQVWFGHYGQAMLALRFDEALRPDVLSAIQQLRAESVQLTLLSGDGNDRVQRLAQRIGIAEAIGQASPEDKLAAISSAQSRGERVAMLGDGVNDAPVLARADVSFAMGHGAVVARLNADGVIVSDRLSNFVDARRLAQRTLRVMHQNLAWAAAYNAACVPLALAGMLPPWAAGLGMALSSLMVVGNSLRLAG